MVLDTDGQGVAVLLTDPPGSHPWIGSEMAAASLPWVFLTNHWEREWDHHGLISLIIRCEMNVG